MQLDAIYGDGAFQMYRPSDGETVKITGLGQTTGEEEKKDTLTTGTVSNTGEF
jgi:hypothetical protein